MKFWGLLFLLAAGLNAVVGLHAWPGVFAGSLDDPDSYMRLERILQGIRAGHLLTSVARDDSGAGVMVDWSRLLDALLWFAALPLAPLLGWRAALFDVGVALGPLGVGALGVALAYAAEPFAARRFLPAAAAAAALLPGLSAFAVPGMVHYHILLLALIAVCAGFLFRAWQGDTGYGFAAGLAGGLAIWLTPETMPFILMIFASLLWRWLQAPVGACITACAAGCFDVLGFGFALDPPAGGYAVPETDRLSVVYVVLGLLLLVGGGFLWRLQSWPDGRRRIVGVAVLAALILAWIALFPQVAEGPYGVMAAAEQRWFFGVMLELQPLAGIRQFLADLLPGCLALLFALFRCFAARGRARWLWAYLAVCTLVALLLADRFLLFIEFPAGIAAALVPLMLNDASTRLARPAAGMLGRVAVLAAMFAAPLLPALARPAPALARAGGPSCSLRGIGALLAPVGGGIVLADPAATPEILYRSQAATVGSLYQHGVPGYLRDRAAWRAVPGARMPAELAATGAADVLFCPAPARHPMVGDLPPDTLWDALNRDQPPVWLHETGANPEGWRLYRIAPHG